MPDGTYFRFVVTLRLEGPPVWRSFLLRGDASFADLHRAVQACGWEQSHLWSFADASGSEIARPDQGGSFNPVEGLFGQMFGGGNPAPDAEIVPLATHFQRVGDSCVYTYDFGDNWEHEIHLDALEIRDSDFERALVDGEGKFPIEDCGGVPGWSRLTTYDETGRDPWDDAETLEYWLAQSPFEAFDLERAKPAFGAVLVDAVPVDVESQSRRIQHIDAPLVRAMTQHVEGALKDFVRKVGLDVRVERATYCDHNARFQMEVSTVRGDGVAMNKQAVEFLNRCHEFGLGEDDLGREFSCDGVVLRVLGLRPRAKKAVLCEHIRPPRDGLVAVCAAFVKRQLAANEIPSSSGSSSLRLLGDCEEEAGA